MGIARYWKWLTYKYPEAFFVANSSASVDHLYIDMNQVFHESMHRVRSSDQFFRRLFRELDKIIRTVTPRKSIYFAIDGPAPCAKVTTQRTRRREVFMSERKSQNKNFRGQVAGNKLGASQFTSNLLTPGLEFMTKIADALQDYITQRMSTNRRHEGIIGREVSVTISGARVIGEGEHKIVSQMLRNAGAVSNVVAAESHVIYGGDADIFLLSLVQNACRRMRVLAKRPNVTNDALEGEGDFLQTWDAEVLSRRLYAEVCASARVSTSLVEQEYVRRDFALISLFRGDDYLPELGTSLGKNGAAWYRGGKTAWDEYLLLRRNRFFTTPLICSSPAEEKLPLSHLEGGWACRLGYAGADFAVEPYVHFSFHEPFLLDLMLALAGEPVTSAELSKEESDGALKYLRGLLWILEMYHHGHCGDFYFVYERNLRPYANANLIARLLRTRVSAGAEPVAPPRSNYPPMRPLSCAICALPAQHVQRFLCPAIPQLQSMSTETHSLLGRVNKIEMSEEVAACRANLKALERQHRENIDLGKIDPQVKKLLKECGQQLGVLKGWDIDRVNHASVDKEVRVRCANSCLIDLQFTSDITFIRSINVSAMTLQSPLQDWSPYHCLNLRRINGEWPRVCRTSKENKDDVQFLVNESRLTGTAGTEKAEEGGERKRKRDTIGEIMESAWSATKRLFLRARPAVGEGTKKARCDVESTNKIFLAARPSNWQTRGQALLAWEPRVDHLILFILALVLFARTNWRIHVFAPGVQKPLFYS